MNRAALFAIVAGFGGFATYALARQSRVNDAPVAPPGFVGPEDLPAWFPPPEYREAISYAETANGMPRNLLARQLYEESRYRPDVINGAIRSSAGAVGIAQFLPSAHPEVNALDPFASIERAGSYMAELYNQFGQNWQKALAAYNWGPGHLANVNTYIVNWLSQVPTPVRTYVQRISADVL